jgi:hypothetical protein
LQRCGFSLSPATTEGRSHTGAAFSITNGSPDKYIGLHATGAICEAADASNPVCAAALSLKLRCDFRAGESDVAGVMIAKGFLQRANFSRPLTYMAVVLSVAISHL